MLLGLGVWPIGDEHRTIRLLPHRLCVAGRGNSASELPGAGSNHFAVERVDLLDHRFGYGGRVEVVGEVVSNQILWHDCFSCNGLYFLVFGRPVALPSPYSRTADRNSTNRPRNVFRALEQVGQDRRLSFRGYLDERMGQQS